MPNELTPNGVEVVSSMVPIVGIKRRMTVPEGHTLLEIVRSVGLPASPQVRATIDGTEIANTLWGRCRPKNGHKVMLYVVPAGGGTGEGKDTLRTVASIAILVAATAAFGPGGLGLQGAGLALVVGVTSAAGALAINALIPPGRINDTPQLLSDETTRPAYALTGTSNRANPFGVVPQVLGKHRVYPPYGALPFTEVRGQDQYLRLLFVIGHGEYEITELKIGNTPIDEFDVDYEIKTGSAADTPVTLYTRDISEQSLSVTLEEDVWRTQTTAVDVDGFSIDVTFPQGLFDVIASDPLGRTGQTTFSRVRVALEYRLVGDTGAWTAIPTTYAIDANEKAFSTVLRGSAIVEVAQGQYDVRLKKERVPSGFSVTVGADTTVWTTLRSIKNQNPINQTGLAMVAMRIKGTDQLNGVIDSFNCVAQTVAPDWNGAAWVDGPTSNPASLYRHVLQGRANSSPLDDSRLSLSDLQDWHEANTAAGYEFNAPIDAPRNVFDLLSDITAAGRASFTIAEGKYSVVRDVPQTVPVQVFTPANSSGYSGVATFIKEIHGIKVRFVNAESGWVEDERTVYDDGFDATTATEFETITAYGVTDKDQAWKYGRYYLAVLRLRRERHTINVDVEHLRCTRGDLVRVVHDVPLFGTGFGRVKTVTNTSGTVWQLALDNEWSADTTFGYKLAVRRPDGDVLTAAAINVTVGQHTTIDYDEAAAVWGEQPEPGDLVIIGTGTAPGVDMLVKSIEPASDLSAQLVLVDAAPGVHTADTGTIPPFDPQITAPGIIFPLLTQPPVIQSVRSDMSVFQSGQANKPRIIVTLGPPRVRFADAGPEYYEVQFRQTADADSNWIPLPDVGGGANQIFIDNVESGVAYDIRVRAVSRIGRVSDWATVDNHTVLGSSSVPPDVINTRVEGSWLTWDYPDPPYDLAGFKVRFVRYAAGPEAWPDGSAAHENLVTDNYLNVFDVLDDSSPYTFMVKAVDSDGNQSTQAAFAVLNLGDIRSEPWFEQSRRTYEDEGFPGTITGATVVSNELVADVEAGAPVFWKAAGQKFWSDTPTAAFWDDAVVNYEELVYEFTFVPPLMTGNRNTRFLLELSTEGGNPKIEISNDDSGLFWDTGSATFWSATGADTFWNTTATTFRPWRGSLRNFKHIRYTMRITIPAGINRGKITHLALVSQGGASDEHFEDLVIVSTGTRLTLSKPYNGITQVVVTLQDDGGTAVGVLVEDKNPVLGPKLKAIDKDGNGVAATIDAHIKGY